MYGLKNENKRRMKRSGFHKNTGFQHGRPLFVSHFQTVFPQPWQICIYCCEESFSYIISMEMCFMFSVVPWLNGCLLHVRLPLRLSGNKKETKTERLTEIEGSEKGRSENENLAHVQSLCFMLWSLWKSEGLTGSQIWSDGAGGRGGVDGRGGTRTKRNATGNIWWSQTNLKGKQTQ